MRRFRIFAAAVLAAAVPAAAHTFGFSPNPASQACLAIGNTTYRLTRGAADVTVRLASAAESPGLRIKLADTPEEADFVFVDDGAAPGCHGTANVRHVSLAPAGAPGLVVALASDDGPADYRIYVRSLSLAPETAAILFAAARMPQRLADRTADRSN